MDEAALRLLQHTELGTRERHGGEKNEVIIIIIIYYNFLNFMKFVLIFGNQKIVRGKNLTFSKNKKR